MRPTPIPDNEIWDGAERHVIGPPDHDPTGNIRPIEMLVDGPLGEPKFSARFVLEPGDLERLTAGEPVWLTLWGHVVPFDINLLGECTCE